MIRTADGRIVNWAHVALIEVVEQMRPQLWSVRARLALAQTEYSTFNSVVVLADYDTREEAEAALEEITRALV